MNDPTTTRDMPEPELRRMQLAEVRRMLRLPEDCPHEVVLRTLYAIGETDKRIDQSVMPCRYPKRGI